MTSFIYFAAVFYFLNTRGGEGSFYDAQQIFIPGDFVIGAIFPIRSYGGKDKGYMECGALEPAFTLQAEAFRLSIEYVNKHILKNYTFGGLVVDECDNAVIGLQSAVRLMAGEISGTGTTDGICRNFRKRTNENFTVIYGMTGGTNSVISERVEPLLEVFCLPLISTYATSPDFDDTTTYPYFLRTVPSDIFQAKAVYDVLKHMKWYSVVVVYEKTPYGDGLQKNFKKMVESKKLLSDYNNSEYDICVAAEIQLSNVSPDFDDMYEKISSSGTNVIVVFTDFTTASKLFQYMKQKHPSTIGTYQYVGTDGWGRTAAASGVEDVIADAITTEFYSHKMPLMIEFLENLTFGQVAQSNNTWLQELVRLRYDCGQGPFCANYSSEDRVDLLGSGAGLGRSYYIFEAVYAFAQAFEKLRKFHCESEASICSDFYEYANGSQLLEALKRVHISEPGQLPHDFVFFNGSNSGPPHYSVFQFQYDRKKNMDDGWIPIGSWSITETQEDGVLEMKPICSAISSDASSTCVRRRSYSTDKAQGCRQRCDDWSRRDYAPNRCCWKCEACTRFQYVNRSTAEDTCVECEMGRVPNPSYNDCIAADPIYPGIESYTTLFTIFLLLAAVGFVSSFVTTVILVWYRRTPSAILASFPLCALATLAITALFASTVLTAMEPTDATCLAQWSIQPFLLTLVIGAMVVHIFQMPRDYLDSALTMAKKSCASVRTRQVIQLVIICTLEIAFIVFCTVWFRKSDGFAIQTRESGTSYVHIERAEANTVIACSSIMTTLNIFILFIVPFLFLCISLIFAGRRYKSRTVFERRENRRVVWCCGLILLLFVFVVTPVFATVQTPVPRAAMQVATLLLSSFIILLFVYVPTVCIMVRGRGNTWLHLTRDVKEDERITSDQLTLSDQVREGSFCEVHRGVYRRNAKQTVEIAAKMAKKRLLSNSVSPADLTDSLLQEIMILRHLRECEHVVRLYGVCNDAESIILVFEYVNGGSCRQFVPSRRAQLTNADLLSIGACIADALCFLKEKSIVHRDVKSDNCLVQERGTAAQHHGTASGAILSKYHAKLADFGVAVEANAGQVDYRRKRLFPERHTAPEGFFGNFSYESDVWSFGVLLWELFALKLSDNAIPYEEVSADNIAEHIVQGNILQKPQLAPTDVYENIMKPCWASEPSKRIAVTRLKQLLLARGRKISGDSNKGNVHGPIGNGLKATNLRSTTPDILSESKFWTQSSSVSSNDSTVDVTSEKQNVVNVNYKTPALSAPGGVSQTVDSSLSSSSHSLKPSILIIDPDENDETAAKEEIRPANANGSGLLVTTSAYRNLSFKRD